MNLIDWDKCERQFVKKTEVDKERIQSLLESSSERLKFLKNLPLTETSVAFIAEGYYEIIKELLVAYIIKNGLKSQNHQCLIAFFYKKNSDKEFEANLISQFSFFRNRLDYYGEKIPAEFYKENKENFENIIKLLNEMIK